MKYRSKVVVIDAVQIPIRTNDATAIRDFYYWMDENSPGWKITPNGLPGVDITTLEGVMHGNPGDWVIKGLEGETYPCKDTVFQAKYEPA